MLADVSEWAAQELIVALSITEKAAENLLTRSLTLVHRLPRTLAALESGVLHARSPVADAGEGRAGDGHARCAQGWSGTCSPGSRPAR